jgi:hypothetical protein
MRYVKNSPDAASLMATARSFGNYDLPSALADLIDNSIKAQSHNIEISCRYNRGDPLVGVLDDGYGMTAEELQLAMRPASSDPKLDRSPDDLGRFGWGLKSASFSQCKRLTVITSKGELLSGAQWDLDDVADWKMGVTPKLCDAPGTEVLWSCCDRLSDKGTITEDEFNDLIVFSRNRIALIYHKYLTGAVRKHPLKISLNGQNIEGFDPFYRDHAATQELEKEEVKIEGKRIYIQPYILPHYSKVTLSEYERLGGEEGFLRTQGFYIYRNHRLIINGTWFRLAKHGELSQLIRISVDIPNSLDHIWKITIDKGDAQLPAVLKNRLKQIVDGLKARSSKIFRGKGGRIDSHETTVWSRHARSGEIRYSINRKHPLIASLLGIDEPETKRAARAVIDVVEQSFPVNTFGEDVTKNLTEIHQTEADPHEFRRLVNATLPMMLHEARGDFGRLAELMKRTEPFSRHVKTVQEILREKGWVRADA